MMVSVNGTGASAGRLVLMDSSGTIFNDQTFTVSAGTAVNSEFNMLIGARPTSSVNRDIFLNGAISSIIVENFPITDALIDQFKLHNPVRTSEEFTPIVQYLMDPDNNQLFFNNSAGTVVCSDGEVVRVARGQIAGNLSTVYSSLRRQWASASDATSPLYQTNVINGHAALQFDGVDDNLSLTGMPTIMFEEQGGKNTFFIVLSNNDNSLGSQFLSGNNYMTLTGKDYPTGSLTKPYFVVHTNVVGDQTAGEGVPAGVDGWQIIAYRRDGITMDSWNTDGVKSAADTATAAFWVENMGTPFTVGWEFNGYMAYMIKYNGLLTDTEVEDKIDELKQRFGL
jgi:hypothetical protein